MSQGSNDFGTRRSWVSLIKLRIFNDDDGRLSKFLSGFVTKIAIPAYLIVSIPQDFTPASLVALGPKLILPVGSMLVLFILSFVVARLIHVNPTHKGLFQSLLFNSNTVMTVECRLIWHCLVRKSLPCDQITIWLIPLFLDIGVYMIEEGKYNEQVNISRLKRHVRKLFTLPMIALLVAVYSLFSKSSYPEFLVADLTDLRIRTSTAIINFYRFSIARPNVLI